MKKAKSAGRRDIFRWGMLATVLLGLLSGCAGDGSRVEDQSAPSGQTPRATSPLMSKLSWSAEEMLVLHCMTKAGLPYRMLSSAAHEDPAQRFAYVIDDVAWAREHAYGMAGEPVRQPGSTPPPVIPKLANACGLRSSDRDRRGCRPGCRVGLC